MKTGKCFRAPEALKYKMNNFLSIVYLNKIRQLCTAKRGKYRGYTDSLKLQIMIITLFKSTC